MDIIFKKYIIFKYLYLNFSNNLEQDLIRLFYQKYPLRHTFMFFSCVKP
jgi:hypothetical protein